MRMSFGTRSRAVLVALAGLGLALAAGSPALAAGGTPTTPTQLFNSLRYCSTDPDTPAYLSAAGGVELEGVPGWSDPANHSPLTVQFRVWPVTDPTQTVTMSRPFGPVGTEASVTVPAADFTDGQTYAWQAQAQASSSTSDWSGTCYFTVDNTSPSPPAITSANYPQGDDWQQPGKPMQFTFDANGVGDVAGFEFGWSNELPVVGGANLGTGGVPQPIDPYDYTAFFVRADHLGGSATITVTDHPSGVLTLYVVSLDRAYRQSAKATYSFRVDPAQPTVTPQTQPQFDQPVTFDFAPDPGLQATSPIVGYTIRTQGGQHDDQVVHVDAAADGTASVSLKLDGLTNEWVYVRSVSANGWVSDEATWFATFDTTPTVSSDVYAENEASGGVGVPTTFTFAPKVDGVVSYTYSINYGDPVTVPADADHEAQLPWTPTDSGTYDLTVMATTADGIRLSSYDYYFDVN